eukprot:4064612-Pyramimonas_sp.AAC.1
MIAPCVPLSARSGGLPSDLRLLASSYFQAPRRGLVAGCAARRGVGAEEGTFGRGGDSWRFGATR